ncbi:type II and III secretion system protein family protein [Dongia soli]|uniref:type II and III secretion system protein family protein n=1 Tax=Dongia soli TaxID=600628 RepID=UPI002A6AD4EC|nr:type II and III secretion system protein family protein [Dongia soli]
MRLFPRLLCLSGPVALVLGVILPAHAQQAPTLTDWQPGPVVTSPNVASPNTARRADWAKMVDQTPEQHAKKMSAVTAPQIKPVLQINDATPPAAQSDEPPVMAAPVPPVAVAPLGTAGTAAPALASMTQEQTAATAPAPNSIAPKKVEIPVPVAPTPAPLSGIAAAPADRLVLPLNKTKGLALGDAVRDIIIGNPDIADIVVRSPKQVYLIGKAIGDTNAFFVDAHGELIHKVDIVVQPDAETVQNNIDTLLPGEHIQAKGMSDSIVLSGSASSDRAAAQARNIARRFVAKDENVVNMIRVTSEQQVLLRVRVAEAQKTVLKELGIDNLLSPTTLGPLTIDAATSALGLGPNIAGTLGISSGNFDSTVRLLEQHGFIRTLAEPNLLAVSGETASMLAGGEYPIPAPQDVDTITIQYKPFGVSLAFLPVVLDSGRISLKISTEVSSLSQANAVSIPTFSGDIQVQGFTTRRANSTVELPSGGSLMIAGLMQNDIISSLNGIPGLMDIPILGTLFSSTSFQRNETELVILVSVVLAKPTDPRQLALPTDGFAPATDLDRYFMGNLQNIYVKRPNPDPNAPQTLQGPIGYIVK